MKLQNNYTSVEQSKRLLELEVPENSADCYFNRYNHRTEIIDLYDSSWSQTEKAYVWCECFVPCWSVGRLIEICKTCEPKKDYEQLCEEMKYCSDFCELIISHIIANLPIIDFSKLEN